MKTLAHVLHFENLLDGIASQAPVEMNFPASPLIEALLAANWAKSLELAEELFRACKHDDEKAFILYCAVAACEMESNQQKRAVWMRRWQEIQKPESNLYCKYVQLYQTGLSAFFNGYLGEAESRFAGALEAAKGAGHRNGEMRALYHLGLVHRDRADWKSALARFMESMEVAQELGATKYQARIHQQVAMLEGTSAQQENSLGSLVVEIEAAIRKADFEQARKLLGRAETSRRKQKIGRAVFSLYAYLPLIFSARERHLLAKASLRWITDPLLLVKILELKESLHSLSESEHDHLRWLKSAHGLTAVKTHSSDVSQSQIFGKKICQIEDAQVRALLTAIFSAKNYELSKEQLCTKVWGFSYDPTKHDGRIYKLIHKTRATFQGQSLFVNTYGGYRLNPALIKFAS